MRSHQFANPNKGGGMKKGLIKWGLLLVFAAALAALPWVLNSCGSSSSDGGTPTTTYTMTLKGATS